MFLVAPTLDDLCCINVLTISNLCIIDVPEPLGRGQGQDLTIRVTSATGLEPLACGTRVVQLLGSVC